MSTTPGDIRIGHGYDLHRLEPPPPTGKGRPLVLGCVRLEHPQGWGPVSHSDGDALAHAITDALLGALAMPDLGSLFPNTDPRHEGEDSSAYLAQAARRVREAGWSIANIDSTVILERPKIGPMRATIRAAIAKHLGLDPAAVNVKGKTHEGVDAVGAGNAVEVHAVALLVRGRAVTITEQVEACRAGSHPRLIARMESGWAVMGESQTLPGYCLLLCDPVVTNLNALDDAGRSAFLRDMAALGDAVLAACDPKPLRINYEMLGNLDPTLHAHVVPRHEAEPEALRTKAIWLYPPQVWNDPTREFDAKRDGALRDAIARELARRSRAKKSELGPMWQQAAAFASRAHAGTVRKDGKTPYVSHPFRVAMTVRDLFGCADPEALAAALLHDVIEDTGTDYDDIEKGFGAGVAVMVAALSKDPRLPEAEREPAYDANLAAADWRARLIKLADVFDNLSDVAEGDKKAQRKMLARAERAIALARPDAAAHGASARAIALLERLVRENEG